MGSYDLYLRALGLNRTFEKTKVLQALGLLEQATALDPNFGSALALAVQCHQRLIRHGWSDDPEASRREAHDLGRRALQVAGDDANVLAIVAYGLASLDRDQVAALALVERAVALNPGAWSAWLYSGAVRLQFGDAERAVENLETVMRLDPIGPGRNAAMRFMGQARFQQGRFSEAVPLLIDRARQADSPSNFALLAASYGHLGDTGAAMTALARYLALSSLPIEAFGPSFMDDPAHVKLFDDGIAMAEGKMPPDGSTGA